MEINAEGLTSNQDYAQCPRCRNYLPLDVGQDNFENLCDRCCRTLINCFPEHSSVRNILTFNRMKYGHSLDGLDEYIEQLKLLKEKGLNTDVF